MLVKRDADTFSDQPVKLVRSKVRQSDSAAASRGQPSGAPMRSVTESVPASDRAVRIGDAPAR